MVGDSAWSDIYTFYIVSSPSQPTNINIDSFDESQVTISWNVPLSNGGGAITQYNVYRQDINNNIPIASLIFTATNAEFSYQDLGVTSGSTYLYTVSAMNAIGGEGP
jgi:hypothetical protein